MDGLIVTALSVKALGSVSGAVLALVFQPPKRMSEFVTRGVFSTMSGMLFGEAVRDKLQWPDTWQMNLSAVSLTAMLSWFVMGAVVRIINKWKPKE